MRRERDDLKKLEVTPERAARMNVAMFQFMGALSALTWERSAPEPDLTAIAMHEANQRAAYHELRWFAHDIGQVLTAQIADGVYLRIEPFPLGTKRVIDIPTDTPRPTIAAAFLNAGNASPSDEVPPGWLVLSDGYAYPTTLRCPRCNVLIDATTIGVEWTLKGNLFNNDPMEDSNTASGSHHCDGCGCQYRARWSPKARMTSIRAGA